MTEKFDASKLPSDSQLRLCQEGFKRVFYLLAAQGFDPVHIMHALLTSMLAATDTHGDDVSDAGMGEWMETLAVYFKSKKVRH